MPAPHFLTALSPRNRWLLGGVLLIGLVLAATLLRTPAKTAQVVQVARTDLTQTVVATGRVNAPVRLDIGSEVTATVLAVSVREGDTVPAGALLMQLSDAEARATLAQAKATLAEARARQGQLSTVAAPVANASLAQAEANLRNAEAEHRRATELVAQGFYSRQKLDDARRVLDTARSALAAARSQAQAQLPHGAEVVLAATRLAQAQAAVEAAQARLQRLSITSPIAAQVLARHVEPGSLAQPGKVLLSLASSEGLRLDAAVDEKHLALMAPGLAARAVADAYPGQGFDAALQWVSPAVDPARGTVDVRLSVPQPPAFLRPDMTVSVEMTVGQQANALVVDAGAVRGMDTPTPWALVLKDGVATRTPLQLGLRGTGVVEVTSGLTEGDLAVPATEKVAEGDRVKPASAGPLPLGGMGMGR
ncbi:MAG: efflux RND transporter periplasmic adaptor subunit [Burkholderiales bacterium]|nr:efflux RND transporter periplasmic adaptor subunit [Burkholderiales bacterium]